jgi:hypothetical protein
MKTVSLSGAPATQPKRTVSFNPARVDLHHVDPSEHRDLAPYALDPHGQIKVLPAEFWRSTTREERAIFGVKHGIYGFPTVELVERLRQLIGSRRAIEIAAGHGQLAKALGIVATDNRMQEWDDIKRIYQDMGQPTVRYGSNVVTADARKAVRLFRPEVVVAQWVTHRFDSTRLDAGGNMFGVDEERIIKSVDTYILIGNEQVHAAKPIWRLPHCIEFPDYLYSRAFNSSRDFIAIWGSL